MATARIGILILLVSMRSFAANYYLDASGGSDGATGRSSAAAWKSLTKLDGTVFKGGDSILFKSGGMWNGQLRPKGSGTQGNPIVITTYGGNGKALINGGGLIGEGAVYLNGESDWDIGGLEITNDADSGADRRGVYIVGPSDRIRLHDLYVHNIAGIPSVPALGVENAAAKATGGIAFSGGGKNVLIENCELFHIDNTGLYTDNGPYPGLRVRNNVLHEIAKNAMIIREADEKSFIEYNVCYQTCVHGVTTGNTIFSAQCKGTTFQNNEGYQNNSTGGFDGSLYDCDLRGGADTKWQYSYSHDNNHGLMWFCTIASDTGIKVRYNVSQNDKGRIFCFAFPLGHADIYNNTIYIGADVSPTIIYEETQLYDYAFYNNIIYNLSKTSKYLFHSRATRKFDYNTFYGAHPTGEPDDPHKLLADPMFTAPGTGKAGIGTVGGYQLQAGSLCINTGMVIADNGGHDYLGRPIYLAPDRGAFEWQGISGIAPGSSAAKKKAAPWIRSPESAPVLRFTKDAKSYDALGNR